MANTLALKAADLVPLATAHGGLLRMIRPLLPSIVASKADRGWFQIGFHILVGMMMAIAYAYVVEPAIKATPWAKGTIYALAVWLLNASVVLPVTGEGFAGSYHLSIAGILWFAVAHTLFFVTTAILFASLRPDETERQNAK